MKPDRAETAMALFTTAVTSGTTPEPVFILFTIKDKYRKR
jgi:hypothetical protein